MSPIRPLGVVEAEQKRLAVTRKVAAGMLGYSEKTIDRLVKRRQLKLVRDGRLVRILVASIYKYLERHAA